MANILLAFITGLTTGGLSCLAVQGGLLASSLAGQIEKDFQNRVPVGGRKQRGKAAPAQNRTTLAQPILAFLIAKLLAYTLLGLLLGLVGQMFQLSVYARAFLQIAIGIFMLGTALRMLNVHPIFRYFAFEPPAFLRRKLRKAAAAGAQENSLASPIFLGFLTVLIPCGVTQAMLAVALSTADPLQGAGLMFAFTLGTSPVFFAVAYFATQLGKRIEKYFMRFVAVVVLVLAILTIDTGITLAGSPVSLTRLAGSVFRPQSAEAAQAGYVEPTRTPRPGLPAINPIASGPSSQEVLPTQNAAQAEGREVLISVQNYGYVPDVVHAKAGVPVTLRLVTDNVLSCSRAFIIPALRVQEILERTGEVVVEIPAQEAGTKMPFSCSMGMYSGTIVFDL